MNYSQAIAVRIALNKNQVVLLCCCDSACPPDGMVHEGCEGAADGSWFDVLLPHQTQTPLALPILSLSFLFQQKDAFYHDFQSLPIESMLKHVTFLW